MRLTGIKRGWTSILTIGCNAGLPGLEKSRIMLLNGLMALTSLSVVGFFIGYLLTGYRYFYSCLYIIPVSMVVWWLNKEQKHAAARNFYFFASLLVFVYWCYEGRGNGNEYTLIGLATTSILIFRERLFVYINIALCAIIFLLYKFWDATQPFIPNEAVNYNVLPVAVLFATVGVIAFQMAFFRDLAFHHDKKLSVKYGEVSALLERQKGVEEELKTSNEKLVDTTAQLEKLVKQKSTELQTYINAINVYIYSTVSDLDGNFVHVNDQVIAASGYSKEELLGKHYTMLSSGNHTPEFFLERRMALMTGLPWRGEVEHKTKDGTLLWFDCVVIPLQHTDGLITYFLTLGLPITERKLHEKIREETRSLLEAIAFRASHKIRGPLARIKGLSELVRRNVLDEHEFRLVAEKLAICSDEVNTATSELVSYVYEYQEQIKEGSLK